MSDTMVVADTSTPPIRHTLVVQAPVVGGQRISVNEAYNQWQQALRLVQVAENVYSRALERETAERYDREREAEYHERLEAEYKHLEDHGAAQYLMLPHDTARGARGQEES